MNSAGVSTLLRKSRESRGTWYPAVTSRMLSIFPQEFDEGLPEVLPKAHSGIQVVRRVCFTQAVFF